MKLVDLAADLLASRDLLRRGELELGLIHVVEEGKELIVLTLRDGIVLVIVALGAADGQAEEDRSGGIDPIDDRIDPELLDVDSSLLVDQRIAMEPRGDARAEIVAAHRSPAS